MIDSDTDKPPSPGSCGRLSIEVLDSTRRLPVGQVAWLRDHIERALETLDSAGEVRVRVVEDAEMARAHARYKGEAGTTDVLTFDLSDREGCLDTDILICIDVAERQAAARGHSAVQELLLYSIHGALHCLGYDDHDEREAARMHRAEDDVLELLGVGVTYARPEHDDGKGAG